MVVSVDLADLNGSNGFVINGIDEEDRSGESVSNAGDINGDGISDLIISARVADPNGNDAAGESYVIFGGNDVGNSGSLELSSLDGRNGFVLNGIDKRDFSGALVSNAGDVNGDGFDDLIIQAPRAGESYVVFGRDNLGNGGSFDLSALNGSNGFVLDGFSLSASNAGDINGDGFDDLIIGAPNGYPNGTYRAGESYVVFGRDNLGNGGSLDLSALNGSNGFVLNGIDRRDYSGRSVSNAGDINGDGFDDLIIGAPGAGEIDSYGNPNQQGEGYVIFGGDNAGSNGRLELSELNGSNGFVINGIDQSDFSGSSVSNAGDINNDGFDDLIIGAEGAGEIYLGQLNRQGESYVVFGGNNVGINGSLDLSALNGSNGFVLNGIDRRDYSGRSVSNAGDINGDGIDDIIIGADRADPNGNYNAGESYVVFGGKNIGNSGSLELSALDGSNGFVLNGIDDFDYSGKSVSNAGDINGDGIDDIIIGAPYADPDGKNWAGESYVVFGSSNIFGNFSIYNVTSGDDSLEGTSKADNIFALAGDDTVKGLFDDDTIDGGTGNDSLFGNNGIDSIFGGEGNDTIWGQGDNDSLDGGSGNDRILGNNGNDNISGGDGNDTLFGNLDNDILSGGAGNDLIFGNEGDDTLAGGQGLDTLWGGAGADTFVVNRGENTTRIKDYIDGEDKIQLGSSLTFDDLTFVQNGKTTQIIYSENNEFLAAVENTNVDNFSSEDFV